MARYNWKANTKSYRAEIVRCTSTDGIYNDIYIQASILYQDNDETKTLTGTDNSLYYYVGLMQNIAALDNVQWRLRLGYNQYLDSDITWKDSNNIDRVDSDFNNLDSRVELNYFF